MGALGKIDASSNARLTEALRHLYACMAPKRRLQFFLLLGLMLVGAVSEMAAIASAVPFLALLAGTAAPEHLGIWHAIFGAFGAASPEAQVRSSVFLFIGLVIFSAGVRLLLTWASQRFVLLFGHDIAIDVHRRILSQPYAFHTARNSSELLAAQDQVEAMFGGVLLPLMQAAIAVVIATSIIAILLRIDPFTATAAGMTIGALYLLVWRFASRRLLRNSTALGAAYSARIQSLQESLGGIRDVIIDDSKEIYLEAFRRIDRRFTDARASTAFIATAPRFIIEGAAMVLMAVLALIMSGREGGLAQALPVIGAVALGALRLLPYLQQLYYGSSVFAGNRASITAVLALMRLPIEPEAGDKPEALPLRRAIRFENVGFSYETARRPTVRDLSFEIVAGSRTALVGRSGSGKSTVADLVMGLLEPGTGTISIDGVPLTAETRRAWRRSIAHVPQAVFLADTSITKNIAFGVADEKVDMARVKEAARLAQLDELIAGLAEGYETAIGEGGVRLSGGQRQRLGIARALYKEAPVLVLDEATSALDDVTEAEVMRNIEAFAGGERTVILITHRAAAVSRCDLVIRMEQGRASEVRPKA